MAGLCWICQDDDADVSAVGPLQLSCQCRGELALAHVRCLRRWSRRQPTCGLCNSAYREIPRDVLRATRSREPEEEEEYSTADYVVGAILFVLVAVSFCPLIEARPRLLASTDRVQTLNEIIKEFRTNTTNFRHQRQERLAALFPDALPAAHVLRKSIDFVAFFIEEVVGTVTYIVFSSALPYFEVAAVSSSFARIALEFPYNTADRYATYCVPSTPELKDRMEKLTDSEFQDYVSDLLQNVSRNLTLGRDMRCPSAVIVLSDADFDCALLDDFA